MSEAAGDAEPSSRPSGNADEATPPAPEGLVGPAESIVHGNIKIEKGADWLVSGAHQQTLA